MYYYEKLYFIFVTVKHIKAVDGITGCYRGLVPKLCGNVASVIACQAVLDRLQLETVEEASEDSNEEPKYSE